MEMNLKAMKNTPRKEADGKKTKLNEHIFGGIKDGTVNI